MVLCDVSLGAVKEYTKPQRHLKAAPEGFNSVKVCLHPCPLWYDCVISHS